MSDSNALSSEEYETSSSFASSTSSSCPRTWLGSSYISSSCACPLLSSTLSSTSSTSCSSCELGAASPLFWSVEDLGSFLLCFFTFHSVTALLITASDSLTGGPLMEMWRRLLSISSFSEFLQHIFRCFRALAPALSGHAFETGKERQTSATCNSKG